MLGVVRLSGFLPLQERRGGRGRVGGGGKSAGCLGDSPIPTFPLRGKGLGGVGVGVLQGAEGLDLTV